MTENNKVIYDGQTLIDLTQDDVTASDVRSGVYFHSADGVRGQGTLTSTSVPTADTIAEWDSSAHMNSEDMTSQEVEDFVDGLNISGGGLSQDGTLTTNVYWSRRGSTMMLKVDNFSITNTSAVTLLGTLSAELAPPLQLYSSGFASGGVVSYVRVDTDGKVYGYRSTSGNLLCSITWGVV